MATSQVFMNEQEKMVEEALEATCQIHSNLAFIKNLSVVYRSDIDSVKDDCVSLVSGGGSGHEPSEIGYIGQGMLSAVVSGQIFSSPNAYQVKGAIERVAGKKGVLLIVKNYTGDRCQFGRAMDKAKRNGLEVDMLIGFSHNANVTVEDDCSIPIEHVSKITGRRGLSGTVFFHKILGALAAEGFSLQELMETGRKLLDSIGTIGVSLSRCTVPGSSIAESLPVGKMQIGLGIHGEPGYIETSLERSNILAKSIVSKFFESPFLKKLRQTADIILMINNLGSTTTIELNVFARDILIEFRKLGVNTMLCMVGSYMTSLNMHGISVSVLVGKEWISCVKKPVFCISWTESFKYPPTEENHILQEAPITTLPKIALKIDSHILRITRAVCSLLIENKESYNKLDALVGDGDCGSTYERFARGVQFILQKKEINTLSELCKVFVEAAEKHMQGTSGAFLCMLFESIEFELDQNNDLEQNLVVGLKKGVSSISNYGGAQLGDRTMLDALIPSVCVLEDSISQKLSIKQTIQQVSKAATEGAEATQFYKAVVGRSTYLDQSKVIGNKDPGAVIIADIWNCISKSF